MLLRDPEDEKDNYGRDPIPTTKHIESGCCRRKARTVTARYIPRR